MEGGCAGSSRQRRSAGGGRNGGRGGRAENVVFMPQHRQTSIGARRKMNFNEKQECNVTIQNHAFPAWEFTL